MKKTKKSFALISTLLVAVLLFSALSVSVFASLEQTAESFNQTVAQIGVTDGLYEKGLYLQAADALWATYVSEGGSAEDAAVADSYASYIEIKASIEEAVAACGSFIFYVNEAAIAEDYATLKANMSEAAKLIDSVDSSYEGVDVAKQTYLNISFDMAKAEQICEDYILLALQAKESAVYSERKTLCASAKKTREASLLEEYPGILDSYPGIAEADENVAEAEAMLATALLDAAPFLIAVRNIPQAKSVPAGVAAAYEALEGIDKTTDGVPAAITEFKNIEKNYDGKVELANGMVDEALALMFGIIY